MKKITKKIVKDLEEANERKQDEIKLLKIVYKTWKKIKKQKDA